MIKIAKEFFEKNSVLLKSEDDFFQSDLYVYFKCLYKKNPIKSGTGFIKVIEKDGDLIFTEFVYHDDFSDEVASFYIGLEGVSFQGNKISNTSVGYDLSKKGYSVIQLSDFEKKETVNHYPLLEYKPTPLEAGEGEPTGTLKFSDHIWSERDFPQINSRDTKLRANIRSKLIEIIRFSSTLRSLNIFDLNILKWTKGRSMMAHNGIDYRSFINFITYNTENCETSRELFVGFYDWYELTFNSIFNNDFSDLMEIEKGKVLLDSIKVNTSYGVLVNSFNPRFYHEVGEMKSEGELFVCTSNMSFKEITKDIDFKW